MSRYVIAAVTLLLLLLSSSVLASQINITSAADLPYTAQSGDTINLPGDTLWLPSSSQAISILNGTYYYGIIGGSGVNDVQINFNGTVVFIDTNGGSSSSRQCGVILRGDMYTTDNNSVIGPGKIIRDIGAGNEGGSDNKCLIIAMDRNTLVRDMDFVIDGDNGTAVEGQVNGVNTRFINCTFTSNSNSFDDRQYFSSGGLKLAKPNSNYLAGPGEFQYIIDGCDVLNSPHFGLAIYDSKALIMNCSLTVDAQNVKYDTLSCFQTGNCGVGNSSANSYSLICNFARPGSEIHDNVIRSGRNFGGSRGIFIENSTTTAADPIRIYNNRLYLNAGPDGENQVGWLRGIRLRTLDHGFSLDHVYIYDNHIEGWVDDDPATTAIGENAVMLQWGLGSSDIGNLRIERNTVICRSLTGNTTGIAAGYGVFSSLTDDNIPAIIRNNHYYSSDYVVWPADLNNAGSAHGLIFDGDTLSFLPPGDSGVMTNPITWRIGNYLQDSWNIIGRDCIYMDGASDTNIVFHNSSSHEITLERDILVAVMGDNGLLVEGAQVLVNNGYGQTVLNGTTSVGVLGGVVSYWYESNTATDSTAFNPFTFSVSKDIYSNDSITAVTWERKKYTIHLAGTNGTIDPGIDPLSNVYNFNPSLLALDFSGESDSIQVLYSSGYDALPDSVIYCYMTGGYPDSAVSNRIAVEYGTYADYADVFVVNVNDPDTLFFSYWTKKVTGSEQWSVRGSAKMFVGDLIAPARIDSLYAEPGPDMGQLDFIWKATGSDGTTGTAAYDSIKYSTSPITTGNWASEAIFANPPPPKPSGMYDTVTIIGLTPGQVYYVAVRAYDADNNVSPIATTSGFARGILVPVTTLDTIDLGPGSVTLYAGTVSSYLNLIYEFQLSDDNSFSSPVNVSDSTPSPYASATFTGLDTAIIYYWRCRAVADDGSESSAWSAPRAFNITTGNINSPPAAPSALFPLANEVVIDLRPTISVNSAADPDGDSLTYFFELYDDTRTTLAASADAIVPDSATIFWTVPNPLSDGTSYSWRARVFDGQLYSVWMAWIDFAVNTLGTSLSASANIISYPNPVSFNSGQRVTFNLPGEPSDLFIQTISGETVLLVNDVSGDYEWDGRNGSGRQVSVGVYLWYVSGNKGKGKIVVTP